MAKNHRDTKKIVAQVFAGLLVVALLVAIILPAISGQ